MEEKRSTVVILDARGRSLGRVCSQAAQLLRGKMDPSFERHIAPRQKVIITNAAHIRFSGRKFDQRTRERYSGYPGGLKLIPYQREFKKNPATFVTRSVAGMIPRNRLRKNILKNLTIYVGDKK